MKSDHPLWQRLPIFVTGVLMVSVLAVGILTNATLRSIEKNLPRTLIAELNALSATFEDLCQMRNAAAVARCKPDGVGFKRLREKVDVVYDEIVRLRETYVVDNLVQASAFHAVVAPAVADLRIWLSEGVSGFGPETETTLAVAMVRIDDAFQKARSLVRDSRRRAEAILDAQRDRLDRFFVGVNQLLVLTVSVLLCMAYLLLRQRGLQHREAVARNALRHQRDLLNSLFENILLGITVWDRNGKLLHANREFYELTGYAPGDIEHVDDWFLRAYPDPEYREKVMADWRTSSSKAFAVREFRIACADGAEKEIEFRGAFLEDGRALVTLSDMTERSRMQQQFQQVQRFEAIGTLAGGIAHDFNNLLMGIQGRASLMALDLASDHPLREHVAAVEEHVRSATNLTRQLLGLARGGKYEVKPVDVAELVASSSAMFGRTRKEISVHADILEAPLVVDADRRQLEQVLLNIYVNAWQAMPNGGDLYLETGSVDLDGEYCRAYGVPPGRFAKIAVTDTGVGMDEAVRRRVFDPFFTTKEKSHGTGLGLASAFGIVKNHGGMITVYSRLGLGTTFNVYLPLSEKAVRLDETAVSNDLIGGTETVLLVDDEELVIAVTRTMLEKLGYGVISARSGREAVEMVRGSDVRIDLVLLDMVMPGMDGGETFDRIREIRPDLPVVLCSGYAADGKAEAILRRGCDGFIQKPFSIRELSRQVRSILDVVER